MIHGSPPISPVALLAPEPARPHPIQSCHHIWFYLRIIVPLIMLAALSACKDEPITQDARPKDPPHVAQLTKPPTPLIAPADHPAPGSTGSASASDSTLTYTAPKSWTEQPATQFLTAAFTTGEGDQTIRITISSLTGNAGGRIPNINRWRGQLSLPPITDIAQQPEQHIDLPSGIHCSLYDMQSADKTQSFLIAYLPVPAQNKTYFIKAAGSSPAIGELKPAFITFLNSITITSL
ncbi:hypothetical protein [Poriferisphaera sp. WC338]|uniref:hypothetical protein n=1 Tax=Poriferisphaera sp. WC338 TaxID=3425129 RepID=UPI003D816062